MTAPERAAEPLDLDAFDVLTFDCYGTLIDWERGILDTLHGRIGDRLSGIEDQRLLESFGRHEADTEAGTYRRYRDVLGATLHALGQELGFVVNAAEMAAFGGSVGDWPAFPDTVDALVRLKAKYRLGVITNCDDDLFAATNRRLGVSFDMIVTAQQAQSYKPSEHNFELAFERLGVPRSRILHVAQSLFHDHVVARRLGLRSVWVDRRGDRSGWGATPVADAAPDLTVPDMRTLADLATGPRP